MSTLRIRGARTTGLPRCHPSPPHAASVRGGGLDEGQREVLGQALADAIAHRTPAGGCLACAQHPAWVCDEHAGDLTLTDAYLQLADELRIGVNR